jgi:hypothetical protein
VVGGKLSFGIMSAGGRLCTIQENPHFWIPTLKVRPPDGTYSILNHIIRVSTHACKSFFLFKFPYLPSVEEGNG